ncbi:hypothetical protein HY448_00775 [Candidatus Pacearchaeota archaeon]|nr:hypothetical protein [Candidatus Pacearchaeota archaeon]
MTLEKQKVEVEDKEQDSKNRAEKNQAEVQEKKESQNSSEKNKEKKIVKKKTEAVVKGVSLPISTKTAAAVCKFIKGKEIQKAIKELQQVAILKKAVPMKGEIPHRKGIMSGRYPKKAASEFIKLLKSLSANANMNEIENPMIVRAFTGNASRPFGKRGRVRRKRTHVTIFAERKLEVKK